MTKSTAVLFDSNLGSGVVIAVEDQSINEFAEYVAERSGLWTNFDTEDGGAILLSSSWSINFFDGVVFTQEDYDTGNFEGTAIIIEGKENDRYIILD